MRIMVTRPSPQGTLLCQQLNEAGYDTVYFPTITIVPVQDLTAIKNELKRLAQYDWMIFVSPQAIYPIAGLLTDALSTWPTRLKIAAVGQGTANVLLKNHLPVHLYPTDEWGSEGLLRLPVLQTVAGQKILLVRGAGGRDLIEKTLIDRGASVTHWITYRRVLPKLDVSENIHLLKTHKIDIIIITSVDSLQNLLTLCGEQHKDILLHVPLLVVSERIKEKAKTLGFHAIHVTRNASFEAILKRIQSWKINPIHP